MSQISQPPIWKRSFYDLIAAEVSRMTRYYDALIQWLPMRNDPLYLFEAIEAPEKKVVNAEEGMPDLSGEQGRRSVVLLNGTFNRELNIQDVLSRMRKKLSKTSRVVAVAYNPYLSGLYRLATALRLRAPESGATFVTMTDLCNIARLSGFEVVRVRPVAVFPWRLLGVGSVLNLLLSALPAVRWLGMVNVITLRPLIPSSMRPPVSIIIPARNERGNIRAAVERMPDLGTSIELIFVEGHSTDGTWEEIERIPVNPRADITVRRFQQIGRGKADAVRLGFDHASGDLLAILDADLTMPPELLTQFYEAWVHGHGDFINGSRLVYPMEGEAMRFLNRLANIGFAKILSAVLETPIGDSLCGTKLVARHDYARIRRWREDFGDFDPFGDFELLFPAASLGLRIIDVPVRYRARTYGSTNIRRFSHGAMLLRMTFLGLLMIRLGLGGRGTR
jgi:Glycosyl transferase family 2